MEFTKTRKIPERALKYASIPDQQPSVETVKISEQKHIAVMIRGMREMISLYPNQPAVIGRSHHPEQNPLGLDLTAHGASQHGVSRKHAQLILDASGQLFILDLNSTNGTVIRGGKLKPYHPALIVNGTEIMLGNLVITFWLGSDRK